MPQPVSIVYILATFPALTQTFVYREVLALREQGLNIQAISIHRPPKSELSTEAKPLVAETFYIFPFSKFSLLWVNLTYLLKRPVRYLRTLAFVLTRSAEPLQSRWRTLRHFLYGMFAVREIDRLRPNYIHAHFGWSASTIALIANRILDIPYSVTLHSFYDKKAHPRHLLVEDKVRLARFVATISEYHRQILIDLLANENGIAEKIYVIHQGLNPDIFVPTVVSDKQEQTFNIIGVGQLIACKGFQVLVEACHHLHNRNIPFRCHILGQGEEHEYLKNLVHQHQLSEQMFLPGRVYQEELRQLLSQADVFVLPCIRDKAGRQDGLPVALMEAMSMQLPVISTYIAGIPELITHECSGLLTTPGDAIALANELQRLFNNPELRRQLGQAGRAKVIKDFDVRQCTHQLAQLLTGTEPLS